MFFFFFLFFKLSNDQVLAHGALTSVYNMNMFYFFNTRARSASSRSGTEILDVWDS